MLNPATGMKMNAQTFKLDHGLRARQRPLCRPVATISLHGFKGSSLKPHAYAHDMQDLCGTWVKDKAASDSMEEAMNLMHLGGVIRQAVKLVRGLKIEQNATTWTMAVFSVISWFKVSERYPLNGQPAQCKRRDFKGTHTGQLLPGKPGPHGGLLLDLQWNDPHAGTGVDEFVLAPRGTAAAQKASRDARPSMQAGAEPNVKATVQVAGGGAASSQADRELHVYSTINVGGKQVEYRTVYHQK